MDHLLPTAIGADFTGKLREIGFTDKTIEALASEDITRDVDIRLMTDDDLDQIQRVKKISMGQMRLLTEISASMKNLAASNSELNSSQNSSPFYVPGIRDDQQRSHSYCYVDTSAESTSRRLRGSVPNLGTIIGSVPNLRITEETDEISLTSVEDCVDANQEDLSQKRPNWATDSCIILIGTTGRGKTTTMNIYTGNNALTSGDAASSTQTTRLYSDHRNMDEAEATGNSCLPTLKQPQPIASYPLWLDTIGFDDAEQKLTNKELIRNYLLELFQNKVNYVHAVVWCITPERSQTSPLKKEAEAIEFLLAECETSDGVGANVILLVREPRTSPPGFNDVQGAKACMPEGWRSRVQVVGYAVDVENEKSVNHAREELNKAFCKIKQPMKLKWNYGVCLDCGQIGDERLFTDFCHEKKETTDKYQGCQRRFMKTLNWCTPQKENFCCQCKELWPKLKRDKTGIVVDVLSPPCVKIKNVENLKTDEKCARDKRQHNVQKLGKDEQSKFEKQRRKKILKNSE